jgi:hypothetical protein
MKIFPYTTAVPAVSAADLGSGFITALRLRNTCDYPVTLAPGEQVEVTLTLADVLDLVAELTGALRGAPGERPGGPGNVLDSRPVPPTAPSSPLTASRATGSGHDKERARP